MADFKRKMSVHAGMRVLDLGGLPAIWDSIRQPLHITILNLPSAMPKDVQSHHKLVFIEGDACNVDCFEDEAFDLVFSNSVIEHVGPSERQAAFAREVRRLGKTYWVQTPAIWLPIEAHTGMPYWWFYPESVREGFLRRWERLFPAWTEMVRGTRVLTLGRLRQLFPEAQINVERLAGIPKSYSAYWCGCDSESRSVGRRA